MGKRCLIRSAGHKSIGLAVTRSKPIAIYAVSKTINTERQIFLFPARILSIDIFIRLRPPQVNSLQTPPSGGNKLHALFQYPRYSAQLGFPRGAETK